MFNKMLIAETIWKFYAQPFQALEKPENWRKASGVVIMVNKGYLEYN